MINSDTVQKLRNIVEDMGYDYVCQHPGALAGIILDICNACDVKLLTTSLRSHYGTRLMGFFRDSSEGTATWTQQKTLLMDESGMSVENAENVLDILWQAMGWQRPQPTRSNHEPTKDASTQKKPESKDRRADHQQEDPEFLPHYHEGGASRPEGTGALPLAAHPKSRIPLVFGILAAAFIILTGFDGLLAWATIGYRLGLLQPSNVVLSYEGLLCGLFQGLMPLAALWLRAKGARIPAILLASAGLACGAAAVYAMSIVNTVFALGWLLFAAAALLTLFFAAAGKHGKVLSGICLALGIASFTLTIWLTFCQVGGYDFNITAAGTKWWTVRGWANWIFGSNSLKSTVGSPASAWMPFSRGLVILAMSFGFRLPAKGN